MLCLVVKTNARSNSPKLHTADKFMQDGIRCYDLSHLQEPALKQKKIRDLTIERMPQIMFQASSQAWQNLLQVTLALRL